MKKSNMANVKHTGSSSVLFKSSENMEERTRGKKIEKLEIYLVKQNVIN